MLDRVRELEGPVAQAGGLEVDNPDPLAVPEEVSQIWVTLSEHGWRPRPADPAEAAWIGIALLAGQPAGLADSPGQPVQPGRVSSPDHRIVNGVVSLNGQLPDDADQLGLVSCFAWQRHDPAHRYRLPQLP